MLTWQEIALGIIVGVAGVFAGAFALALAGAAALAGFLYLVSAMCRLLDPKPGEQWRDWRSGELLNIVSDMPDGGYFVESEAGARYEDADSWRRAARHRYRVRRAGEK